MALRDASTVGSPIKLVWWTPIATTNQTAMVEGFRRCGIDAVACYFRTYDDYRKGLLGWRDRPVGENEYFVSSLAEARRAIPDFDRCVHVVPGYWGKMVWRLAIHCVLHRRSWYLVTEGSRGGWRTWPLRKLMAVMANRWARQVLGIGARACREFEALGVDRSKLGWTAYATPEPPSEALLAPRAAGCGFVYAGALTERKACDLLAAVWPRVLAEAPEATLRIVGEGPLKSLFESMQGVELRGSVPPERVYAEIAGGDVMLLPSRYDPWGVSLMEGAICGMAMIGSDAVNSAELIEDGVNGVRVRSGDGESLLAAMLRYAKDPALARRHGIAARESALKTTGEELARGFRF